MPGVHKKAQPDFNAALQEKKPSKFRRNRRLVRLRKFVNTPLFVTVVGGLLVFLISNHVQERFAADQERFQIKQTKRADKLNAAIAAQDEIIRTVNKRLTGIAALITPYRDHFQAKQYRQYLQYSTDSAHEWDYNQRIINLKVKFYFTDRKIQEHWNSVGGKLDSFDDQVSKLNNDFKAVTNPSDKKTSDKLTVVVKACDDTLDQVDADLEVFSGELNDFIKQEEAKPLIER